MNLLNLIEDKYKIISIVGLAKNTGKTTTLNHLIKEAKRASLSIGITSIGRDGEPIDLVTETEKPKINVYENMLIATAEDLIPLGTATVKIIKRTNYRTAVGNVIIAKVQKSGSIQIAGPNSQSSIKEVANMMLSLGAPFVILDGAIDRKASASPFISEATILSTGAVLSKDMDKVIEETTYAINIMSLPELKDKRICEIIKQIIDNKKIAVIDNELSIDEINIKTALGSGKIISAHINENTRYLVLPGSLVSSTINELLQNKYYKNTAIVISDSTKAFLNSKELNKYNYLGVKIYVLKSINLIALTLNPTSPYSNGFNPKEFLEKMQENIKGIPVLDVGQRKVVKKCQNSISIKKQSIHHATRQKISLMIYKNS